MYYLREKVERFLNRKTLYLRKGMILLLNKNNHSGFWVGAMRLIKKTDVYFHFHVFVWHDFVNCGFQCESP